MSNVGVGRRAAAWIVDLLVSFVWSAPFAERIHTPGHVEYRLMNGRFVAVTLIWIAYGFLMEGAFGATVGKFVLGIRVVRSDGGRLDFGSAFIRNIARVVDGFPYFLPYLLGAIFVWSSPTKQRLGDRWANTVVVRTGTQPMAAPGSTAYSGAGMQPPQAPQGSAPPTPPMPPMPPVPPVPPAEG